MGRQDFETFWFTPNHGKTGFRDRQLWIDGQTGFRDLLVHPMTDSVLVPLTNELRGESRRGSSVRIYYFKEAQTEKNKMSKIWEVETPVTFIFKYKGENWMMPVNRVHYFCTYWQEGTPKEWWISFKTPIEQ